MQLSACAVQVQHLYEWAWCGFIQFQSPAGQVRKQFKLGSKCCACVFLQLCHYVDCAACIVAMHLCIVCFGSLAWLCANPNSLASHCSYQCSSHSILQHFKLDFYPASSMLKLNFNMHSLLATHECMYGMNLTHTMTALVTS